VTEVSKQEIAGAVEISRASRRLSPLQVGKIVAQSGKYLGGRRKSNLLLIPQAQASPKPPAPCPSSDSTSV